MSGREYKAFDAEIKEIDGRKVTGIAAVMGNVDSYYDRIWTGAFKKTLKEDRKRIKHLWQHDFYSPPIAVSIDLREVGREDLSLDAVEQGAKGGLLVTREYLDTPRADEVFKGILAGAITEMSFAYDAVKFDFEEEASDDDKYHRMIRNLREVKLWETSDVLWGANDATQASKSAMPYRDCGVAPEGETWAKPSLSDFTDEKWADLSDGEKDRIASHYAWRGEGDSFGDLKLPHHRAAKTGTGPAVWNGVKSAMSVCLGGMGGVDIPDAQRRSVYNHLAKHYEQFSKEPPDFKWSLLTEAVSGVLKVEGVPLLDTVEMAVLESLYQKLLNNLERAEPLAVDPALTRHVLQRLAIAEHTRYGGDV